MTISTEDYAYLAKDAYVDDRDHTIGHTIPVHGHNYKIIDAISTGTGYQARAYQRIDTGEVVIAERGTEPRANDAITDFKMVGDQTNQQWPDAQAFAQRVINKVAKDAAKNHYTPNITTTGHSLGGTLAELTAAKYGLKGETFNSYGAADLNYGVPEGGTQVINHVLAGDVVSAASRHFGVVRTYATEQDITGLRDARYLDNNTQLPPNPLLAMRLDDHGIGNFAPQPGKGFSVLNAANEVRYQHYQHAIDHYRADIQRERAELGEVMRRVESHNIANTLAGLPQHIQWQLMELHSVKVDAPIQRAVEQNAPIRGIEQGLDQATATVLATAQNVHRMDERIAANVRQAGVYAAPVMPDAGWSSEAIAGIAHLHGQMAQGVGQVMAVQTQVAKQVVEQSAHNTARAIQSTVHLGEMKAVQGIDQAIGAYQSVKAGAEALNQKATHAYGAVRQAVSLSMDAVGRTYNTLAHPEQWVEHPSKSSVAPNQRPELRVPAATAPTSPATPASNLDAQTTRTLQGHLNTLGVTDMNQKAVAIDGVYGPFTRTAVARFQHAQGMPITGHADEATLELLQGKAFIAELQRKQASKSVAAPQIHASPVSHSMQSNLPAAHHSPIAELRPFSDPNHPQHALYNTLKEGFPPDTTPEWLAHATATCYTSGINKPDDLGNVYGNEKMIRFECNSLFGQDAYMDTTQAPPTVQQTMQHVQQFDQQQAQMMSEIRAENARTNAQAQQGPVLGGPPMY